MGAGVGSLIARLQGEGRLRVWSLAATFFGDAVAPRGGAVAMADLSAHLETLGAESGAIRTAMSRLARDGWVDRTRVGRKSYYRLAGPGAATTREATPRIYAAAPPEWSGRWTVAIAAPGRAEDDLAAAGLRRVAPSVWLAPGEEAASLCGDGLFLIEGGGGSPPDWARALLSPPELGARYAALSEAWSRFDLADASAPEAAMAARTLLIHDWRRVLLRDAPLPRALRPEGWPGAAARDLVAKLYRALAPASERWLDGCEAAPGRTLPAPEPAFAARFGGL
ncbi:MAG: PaaX family transcriptional regulator C-terminal domain-containing protein [Pseudomonadota bacterium]